MVATENKAINPDLKQDMAKRAGSSTVEIGSGHAVILSHRFRLRSLSNR